MNLTSPLAVTPEADTPASTTPLTNSPRRVLLVTDAWQPQTNGVVTTLSTVVDEITQLGVDVTVIHPGDFKTMGLPSYPEIRIARNPGRMREQIEALRPQAIHIATEGPLGVWARRYVGKRGIPFTTSLHTKFPEYVRDRIKVEASVAIGYRFLRWFHNAAERTLCTTAGHQQELAGWGLDGLVVWGRGVKTQLFHPRPRAATDPRNPRLLYVGRVAVEKNIEAFLRLELPGEKIIVGDGPAREKLQAQYPQAHWLGYRRGEALAQAYADGDVFVFPSLTDTFGLVMLEAMACGTPVAGFPVTGPIDVVQPGVTGALNEDLTIAITQALKLDRARVADIAAQSDWQRIALRFHDNLAPIDVDTAFRS